VIYISIAIGVLVAILILLIWHIIRQHKKYSDLRALYTNGDGGGLGEHASIQEWERLAMASMEASRNRRKNGTYGKA
jgi:hypothetical protein